MAKLIKAPTEIKACGNKENIIKGFIGNVNSNTEALSIAKIESPQGWKKPGQIRNTSNNFVKSFIKI